MSIEPPALKLSEVNVEPIYALGFPAYAGLTLAPEPAATSLNRVPAAGWQGSQGMVGISLSPLETTRVIYCLDPLTRLDADAGTPMTRLRSGECRRVLIDLTELLPEHLAPGHYAAVISFGPEHIRAVSSRVHLTFRSPTQQEEGVLVSLHDEVLAKGSWGQWTRQPPLGPAGLRLPWGSNDPLRFNLILRSLFYGSESLSKVPFDRLDVLTGLFVPEREALRAELLAFRNDPTGLAEQIARVNRDYPGLRYWTEMILAGQSEIAWTRRSGTP